MSHDSPKYKEIRRTVKEWFDDEFIEVCKWKNEYGYIWTEKSKEEPEFWKIKRKRYQKPGDFMVHLYEIDNIVCFKILPSEATPETCHFLRLTADKLKNIHWFDGVVSEYDKNDNNIWFAMHTTYVGRNYYCVRNGWDLSHSFESAGMR